MRRITPLITTTDTATPMAMYWNRVSLMIPAFCRYDSPSMIARTTREIRIEYFKRCDWVIAGS
ncbi:hypothetical protein D3C78_1842140 [compost metagenome]